MDNFLEELLNEFKKPIITTSVNLHGQDAINNIDEVIKSKMMIIQSISGLVRR